MNDAVGLVDDAALDRRETIKLGIAIGEIVKEHSEIVVGVGCGVAACA